MNSIIITAGGIGKRMGSEIPKQFLLLQNFPILMHSIQTFFAFDSSFQLILTLPQEWKASWIALCEKHNFQIKHQIVSGGKERFHSIQNALQICEGTFVAIHDGVRPLVSHETIQNVFDSVSKNGGSIPVTALTESLRFLTSNTSKSVDRSLFKNVQTPQCFDLQLLKEAYKKPYQDTFTDDASVFENIGPKVTLVEGNIENIKITTPIDLLLAEAILAEKLPTKTSK